jgi:hypothetical protein
MSLERADRDLCALAYRVGTGGDKGRVPNHADVWCCRQRRQRDTLPVNRDDAREILEIAQIDPTLYSLEGERHEALSLVPWGQSWQVFLSERGVRYEERTFDTEDAACIDFLKRLLALSRRR